MDQKSEPASGVRGPRSCARSLAAEWPGCIAPKSYTLSPFFFSHSCPSLPLGSCAWEAVTCAMVMLHKTPSCKWKNQKTNAAEPALGDSDGIWHAVTAGFRKLLFSTMQGMRGRVLGEMSNPAKPRLSQTHELPLTSNFSETYSHSDIS